MARERELYVEVAHRHAGAIKDRRRAESRAVKEQAQRQREAQRRRQQADAARLRGATEKELRSLYVAAQEAEVERLNGDLAVQLADIDNVLSATLEVDDYIPLERHHLTLEHSPFTSPYSTPIPPPTLIQASPEPEFVAPEAQRGMGAVFGKRKHAEAVAAAQAEFAAVHQRWQQAAAAVPVQQHAQLAEYAQAEEARQEALAADRARYSAKCMQDQSEFDAYNASLDQLIGDLGRGAPEAVEDYLGLVLLMSVYPAGWPGPPACTYDARTRELTIELHFPAPGDLPTVKQYKYVRASDTITTTPQTQSERKERYAALVNNMILRTLHEVWEADRGGKVDSISLVGSVPHVNPATGKDTTTPLVAAAVDRATFAEIDLRRVAPAETLRHLGAVVSKNPHALTPITLTAGVRAH
jgi:restriction system protein